MLHFLQCCFYVIKMRSEAEGVPQVCASMCTGGQTLNSPVLWLPSILVNGLVCYCPWLKGKEMKLWSHITKTESLKYCFWLWKCPARVFLWLTLLRIRTAQARATGACFSPDLSFCIAAAYSHIQPLWNELMWSFAGVRWAKSLTRCHNMWSKSI